MIFGYQVSDPQRYRVAEVDSQGNVLSIEEKPVIPKSNLAIPGLYFFDRTVSAKASTVQKSKRGELEITSVLEFYQEESRLQVQVLERGTAWMDCGTINSLNDACNYIRVIEERQGSKVGAIEEIAWRNGWITAEGLNTLAQKFNNNNYGSYLASIVSSDNLPSK